MNISVFFFLVVNDTLAAAASGEKAFHAEVAEHGVAGRFGNGFPGCRLNLV